MAPKSRFLRMLMTEVRRNSSGLESKSPKGEGHEHLRTDHLFSPIDRRFPIWQARPMAVSGRP